MSTISNQQQQHSHQEESGKQPLAETHNVVHDACQLLESSLSALVADSAVLRQLVCLKQAIMDGNNNSQDLCLKLIQIDRIVTELENKMKTFRDVVKEEQKTICNIEKCAAEARVKVEEFQQWRDRVLQQHHHHQQQQQHGYHDPHNAAFGEQQETLTHDDRKDWQAAYRPQNPRDENDNIWGLSLEQQDDYDGNHRQEEGGWQEGEDDEYYRHYSQNSGYDGGGDDNDDDDDALVKMDWVTQEEFMQVEPHTRAHISRSLVNDAVQDIQQMFQEKETSRLRDRRRNQAMLTWNNNNDQEEVLTCSEQEMRQSCGFFCSGESSARTVLMILRNLGRIKQIPSGNGKIVYALN